MQGDGPMEEADYEAQCQAEAEAEGEAEAAMAAEAENEANIKNEEIRAQEENKMEENKIVESPHSVKFSCNAKGQLSGECKVYAGTPEEALTKASSIMAKIEVVIKEKNNLVGE